MAPSSHLHAPWTGLSPTSMAIQFVSVLLMGLIFVYVRRDFQAFIALGPGGTPPTWNGYLRIKLLSLFALRRPYAPMLISEDLLVREGSLLELPNRKHARPQTKGIAPHRQTEQRAQNYTFETLAAAIKDLAPGKNGDLTIGTSCFEKHGTGLFSTCPATRTCRGEIVHVHPSDGSMHMTLHPADANAVLKAGWGERHPLAGVFLNRFLPYGFMMVYAPQNDEEIEVVLRIIHAACWFVSQGDAANAAAADQASDLCKASAGPMRNYINQRQIEDPTKVLEKIG